MPDVDDLRKTRVDEYVNPWHPKPKAGHPPGTRRAGPQQRLVMQQPDRR